MSSWLSLLDGSEVAEECPDDDVLNAALVLELCCSLLGGTPVSAISLAARQSSLG